MDIFISHCSSVCWWCPIPTYYLPVARTSVHRVCTLTSFPRCCLMLSPTSQWTVSAIGCLHGFISRLSRCTHRLYVSFGFNLTALPLICAGQFNVPWTRLHFWGFSLPPLWGCPEYYHRFRISCRPYLLRIVPRIETRTATWTLKQLIWEN